MKKYDVTVCGGGPAGVAAAVAAARGKARTLLVERYTHLGGMATGARVACFCDTPGGPLFEEIIERLQALGAVTLRVDKVKFREPGRYKYNAETLKAVLMEMATEAGVDLLLDTTAYKAVMDENRIIGINTANKAGSETIHSDITIDATADADIAASAGAAFLQGDPEDGRIQHCNYRWSMGNVDWAKFKAEKPDDDELAAIFHEANSQRRIKAPSAIFKLDPAFFPWDNINKELVLCNWELQHIDPTDPEQSSRITAECQTAAIQIARICREKLPGFEQCKPSSFASALGTRESRRIKGKYQVTGKDLLSGAKFDDAAAKAWFWIDFHDPAPGTSIPYEIEYVKANQPPPGDWYEIPYRSLLPESVKNLIVAGRCISCDRPAQASLRVMPTCIFTGTGAGTAAAMAVKANKAPDELELRGENKLLNLY